MSGRIHQISISPGGVPKQPVEQVRITPDGLEGDWQNDRKHHGGPDRAVCLFSLEVIERLRAEGHPISPGAAGENLTVAGLDWAAIVPGVLLAIGEGDQAVELEVVSYTRPCSTIRAAFCDAKLKRIDQDLHPGESRVYARVRRAGVVRVGAACRARREG